MQVFQRLAAAGLAGVPELAALFEPRRTSAFLEFLDRENRAGGFFSEADAARILERHLFECLVYVQRIVERCEVTPAQRIADVGSGPGLPGYLFACLREPPEVTLIDASRRRLGRVEAFHTAFDPAPAAPAAVRFVVARVEELRADLPGIVMRAFLPLPFSVEVVCRLQQPGGWIALCAGAWAELDARTGQRLATLGYEVESADPLPALASLGQRNLVVLRCVRTPTPGWPRPWPRLRREMQEWHPAVTDR